MKKILSLVLTLVMVCTLSTSFASTNEEVQEKLDNWAANVEEYSLPLGDGTQTLTIMISLSSYVAMFMQSYEEHTVIQEMEKRLGINLKFIHSSSTDDGTFFNMMLASGDWPDIIIGDYFNGYPGGYDGAVEDGILINTDELVKKYAYNYMHKLASQGVETYKNCTNDEGSLSIGCSFNPDFLMGVHNTGAIIRKDYLDAVGLDVPETLDELTTVLRAFRDQLGIEVPLALGDAIENYRYTWGSFLSTPWNVSHDAGCYQVDDEGNVFYPRVQEGFKEFLKQMNSWYNEGLIDRDMVNRTNKDALKMLYNGRTGIAFIGNWQTSEALELGKLEDENFDIVPLRSPRLTDPEAHVGFYGGVASGSYGNMGITTSCENKELAIKFLDYLYSDESNELCTWGVGDLGDGNYTATVNEDGTHTYGDIILNNPDYPFETIRHKYVLEALICVLDEEAERAEYNTQLHLDCWDAWGYNSDNTGVVHDVTRTAEEDSVFNVNQNEIKTYSDEMMLKFIFGEADIDTEWDSYVEHMYSLGLQENIDIEAAAYARYLAR
ncbi:MAG TPA: extracellular solute-binding protein [Candidatus Limiplasma sp.]|nr:extracellular solute-binding protein [Candidatus Limiplasma sp.]